MRPEMHDAAGVALAVDITQHEFQISYFDYPMVPILRSTKKRLPSRSKKASRPSGRSMTVSRSL